MIEMFKRFFTKTIKVGSGSTVNLKNMFDKPLSKDCGFVMIEGKGDRESLKEFLNNSNRENDVFIIDFTTSKKSQSIKIEPQNMQ